MDNEDITVGVWLAPFNTQRKHNGKFNMGLQSCSCNVTYSGVREKHEGKAPVFTEKGTLCTPEHQHSLYSYVAVSKWGEIDCMKWDECRSPFFPK